MKKYFLIFLIALVPFKVLAMNNQGIVDPPVTIHNETEHTVRASWYVEMPKYLKVTKYEATVAPKKSVTLKDGITYYATSNSKIDARIQKNRVEASVEFLDKNGKEIKDETKGENVRVFGRHEIAKDHLLTLNIYIKDKNIEFKEVEKK